MSQCVNGVEIDSPTAVLTADAIAAGATLTGGALQGTTQARISDIAGGKYFLLFDATATPGAFTGLWANFDLGGRLISLAGPGSNSAFTIDLSATREFKAWATDLSAVFTAASASGAEFVRFGDTGGVHLEWSHTAKTLTLYTASKAKILWRLDAAGSPPHFATVAAANAAMTPTSGVSAYIASVRKPGEGGGAGTGCVCTYYQTPAPNWYRSDMTVATE